MKMSPDNKTCQLVHVSDNLVVMRFKMKQNGSVTK